MVGRFSHVQASWVSLRGLTTIHRCLDRDECMACSRSLHPSTHFSFRLGVIGLLHGLLSVRLHEYSLSCASHWSGIHIEKCGLQIMLIL